VIIKAGGCYGSELPGYHSAGFLVNGRVLLEGGTVTSTFTMDEQLAITDVLVSHTHLDHIKELAFLADNRAGRSARPFVVTGVRPIVEGVRRGLFNDRLWPDFSRIPSRTKPTVAYRVIAPGRYARVGGLDVKPVAVEHAADATGYILREPGVSVVYTGDTGPTRAIWKAARALPDLKAVIVEASFPNGMEDVAIASGHLTPALLDEQLDLLGRPEVAVYVVHMKPLYLEQILAELRGAMRHQVQTVHQGRTYTIS
jgi:cAMP phosphodiesterase